MFSISSPTFGLLRWSSLYPLIDFPIERQTWERWGADSAHCFHLCNTMMISPAAACQPPLPCSCWTSSAEKLLLITSPCSNCSSPGKPWIWDRSVERDSEVGGICVSYWPGVMECTFGCEGKQDQAEAPRSGLNTTVSVWAGGGTLCYSPLSFDGDTPKLVKSKRLIA